ncbi:hypothetical protein [Methylomonas denitrificans]|uniref:Uncharacterized protein n=1 Tax=Methylomonas denitrificans TaxID=1538553 RepID=A0A140E5F2_9GAMM|nr:hypothetical protein [Methylomonas denitrificans]AMK75626.1 hypothetical protein JT25_003845 [Methylomonas denitrificans]
MLEPVKVGIGEYLSGFYASLVSTTKPMDEYIQRGVARSIAWAPSRMVDSAEEMLAAWQRNDTDSAPTRPPKLPVILVGMDQSYTPTAREYGAQIANSEKVIMPNDPKQRLFGLRTVFGDIRVQMVVAAADEPTARSIAAQLMLYMEAVPNRRVGYTTSFAGVSQYWVAMIESTDVPAAAIHTGVKNIVMLAVDITLKAQIPIYDAPKVGEPNDGKGVPGTDDPAGYPVVIRVDFDDKTMKQITTVE